MLRQYNKYGWSEEAATFEWDDCEAVGCVMQDKLGKGGQMRRWLVKE